MGLGEINKHEVPEKDRIGHKLEDLPRLYPGDKAILYCCACEVTLVITDTLIAVLTYLLTYHSGSSISRSHCEKKN